MWQETKRADAFIKRTIRKYEIKQGIKIDDGKLESCHDYYKRVLQQKQRMEIESNSVGNTKNTTGNSKIQHAEGIDTKVLFWVRGPP